MIVSLANKVSICSCENSPARRGRRVGREPGVDPQRDERLLLRAEPPRAAGARGPAGRRDPQDPTSAPTNYPGDSAASENWPGFAPGTHRHPQRAVAALLPTGRTSSTSTRSRRCCGRTARADLVVADGSPLEFGTLGAAGRGAGLAGRGRVPAAADGHPDPRGARALRRGRRPGPHRDLRRLRPRPAPRRPPPRLAGSPIFLA